MIVYPSICYICSVFFNDAKPTIQSNFTSLFAFVASSASFSNRIFCLKKKWALLECGWTALPTRSASAPFLDLVFRKCVTSRKSSQRFLFHPCWSLRKRRVRSTSLLFKSRAVTHRQVSGCAFTFSRISNKVLELANGLGEIPNSQCFLN